VPVPATALTIAIRREILSVLAGSAAGTIPAATAQVARGWSARRRLHGESPSSVRAAEAIVFQVGADLEAEMAALRAAEDAAGSGDGRSARRPRRDVRSRTGRPWQG
jgi:hypothetical protein